MESPKNRYILGDCRPENMCRFCGCEDKENVNIFLAKKTPSPTSSQSEKAGIDDLLSKISTVYPFVVSGGEFQGGQVVIIWRLIGYYLKLHIFI